MNKELKTLLDQLEESRKKRDVDGIFQHAAAIYKQAEIDKNTLYQGIACYHISNSYFIKGQYEKARDTIHEGLQLLAIEDDVFYHIMALNLAGIIYGAIGDEIETVNYMLKAYYLSIESGEVSYLHIILNNLGVLFMDIKSYDIASSYFRESFDARNILSFEDIKINDGFVIINLLGCSVHQKDEPEYTKWLSYYQAYHDRFDEDVVETDYLMYEVYRSYYQGAEDIEDKLNAFMIRAARNEERLHVVKDEIQLFDICMEIKNKDYGHRLLQDITAILKEHSLYKKASILNDLTMRYYKTFHMDREFKEELLSYYEIKESELAENRHIIKQTLLTKIELENSLYHQSEIIKKNEELSKNIEIEEFTMLLNKSSFRKYVVNELEHMHSDQYVCLFLIDIDHFKEINDTYGHLYGDKILLQVADILRKNTRETDYIGRIGGDEFCIFMKNILSLDYLDEVAKQLIKEFHKISLQEEGHVSASVGICATNHKSTYDEMFASADEKMYETKHDEAVAYHLTLLA